MAGITLRSRRSWLVFQRINVQLPWHGCQSDRHRHESGEGSSKADRCMALRTLKFGHRADRQLQTHRKPKTGFDPKVKPEKEQYPSILDETSTTETIRRHCQRSCLCLHSYSYSYSYSAKRYSIACFRVRVRVRVRKFLKSNSTFPVVFRLPLALLPSCFSIVQRRDAAFGSCKFSPYWHVSTNLERLVDRQITLP